jgi:hypothetical protein
MRASAVVKRQSIVVSAVLRSWFHAVTSATRVAASALTLFQPRLELVVFLGLRRTVSSVPWRQSQQAML